MTNSSAQFRQLGSFTAGFLIGLSIVVATFALTDADSSAWQTVLVFVAPVTLMLGLALQVLVTPSPGAGLRRAASAKSSRADWRR